MIVSSKNLQKLAKNLQKQTSYSFSVDMKRKPTRKDLDKYDVLWVGANLGGICSQHFDKVVHGKYSMMCIFDHPINQQYPMRGVYEQQRAAKTDYLQNSSLAVNMYTAKSDGIGVKKYLPEENALILKNDRRIEYDHLIIAQGMKHAPEKIEGLDEAWRDFDSPVFVSKDHDSWNSNNHKYARWHYNYKSGDAIFCIPPYPFAGEIECYNFLTSAELWSWYKANGNLSPINSFTVINANDSFCQFNQTTDQWLKSELPKRGINIELGLNLEKVDKETQKATFKNVQTGETQVRDYSNLYTIMPCRPHDSLVEAELATAESNWLLDVDRQTLKHNKYDNIFGLGDCCNLPTTKSFWAGFYQIHVVRNNLERSIKGQSLNGLYDGYTQIPMLTGQAGITYIKHYYDGKDASDHLSHRNGGPISRLRYLYWGKPQRKKFQQYYLNKTWGPPYHKFKKTFKELPGGAEPTKAEAK